MKINTNRFITLVVLSLLSLSTVFAQTKKDGTPDKRYKASKTASRPSVVTTQNATETHLKADGTPDRRYQKNTVPPAQASTIAQPSTSHLKADGTPDKRYRQINNPAVKSNASVQQSVPPNTNLPVTARNRTSTAAARPMVPQNSAPTRAATTATGIHLKKDGTPDMRYKENRRSGQDKDGSADKRYKGNKP